jgi:anaerobic magnesium-protoporphyrin IX monomethyl ester cyclase
MRILLINPPSNELYQTFLPLGLAYIAGSLLKYGHEVTVWDINAERWPKREVLRRIREIGGSYDLVGVSALAGDYPYVRWLLQSFKKIHPNTKLILGGYLASALPQFLMENLPLDFVAVGGGEGTIVELADVLRTGAKPDQVQGIYFRNDAGVILSTPLRPRLHDLEQLPLPPWDYFPMNTYLSDPHPGFQYHLDNDGTGIMSIMASRGCPFNCIYCDHTIKGYKPRYRSVKSVISEIETLMWNYGDKIRFFYFWDDIFIWDRDWIYEFCEAVLREGLKIRWGCNCHVNIVKPRLMETMKEAGCENVRFGIESGSQKILDALNKGVTTEKAFEALKISLNAGLTLTLYFMVGMFGESRETIHETIEFFQRLINPSNVHQIRKVHCFMLTPFPGTQLFEKVAREGCIDDIAEFMQRDCDAYTDIPLNISGQTDHELLMLKKGLEEKVSLVISEEMSRLYNILFDMRKESRQRHPATKG